MATMGISMITALEIFSNPSDLKFSIVKEKKSKKLGFVITRGPGHNDKILLSSGLFAEKPEEAIASIKEILEFIYEKGVETSGEADPIDNLSPDLITTIICQLNQHHECDTSMLSPGVG